MGPVSATPSDSDAEPDMASTPTTGSSATAVTAGANSAEARTASAVLTETRQRVEPELRAVVAALPESIREICDYHFGWIDPPTPSRTIAGGNPVGSSSTGHGVGRGKAIRPALVLACAQAVGGEATVALPAAVAVELIHNFSLLHDDVMDRDTTRRGRPTAWTMFGSGPAILAGDALLARAFHVLATSEHPSAARAARWLSSAVVELIAGQHADISFEGRDDVQLAQCEDMARGKTAALLGCCCALGALFAGATGERIEALRRFGVALGLAFQHVDDLLGIWGDPTLTGKPAYSDLRNTKKSLPVVAALSTDTAAAAQLRIRYQPNQITCDTDFTHIAELIDQAGGRTYSQTQAERLRDRALEHLQRAQPSAEAAGTLCALAALLTHRDR